MSPTQRSIELLKKQGWTVWKAEHWCPFSRRRKDAFGFADLICVKPSFRGTLYVQTTSGSGSSRVKKIRETAAAGIVMAAGNPIIVHGWAKRGARGQKKTWTCRETNIEANQ